MTLCKFPFQQVVLFDYDGKDSQQYLPCMESFQVDGVCETHKLPNIMNWEGEQLDPLQVFRHEKFTELQASHLAGMKHPWCKYCWESDNPRYKNLNQYEKDCTGLMIDFYCSNQCNLACRHCTPFASSKLKREASDEIFELTDGFFFDKPQNSLKSVQWDWIKKNMHKISGLTLSGGEPLLMKEVIEVLSRKPVAHMNLQLRTNGLLLGEHVEMLNRFNGVYLHLSVDAVDDLYSYIRYPGKFEDLENSFHKYKDNATNLRDCYISVVVNALNALNLNEIELWAEHEVKYVEITPKHRGIGIRSMPKELCPWDVPVKPNKDKMKREIEYFDRTRNQNYRDFLHPELIRWLDD